MGLATEFLDFLWSSFLLLAPMLLLGLFLSGVMHVFISRQAILRWFRDDGLKSVSTSAAIGVPMPVVQLLRRARGGGDAAARVRRGLRACRSSSRHRRRGADSILVTNAFFGPVVAVVRPVISFVTAVVAGVFCIGLIRGPRRRESRRARPRGPRPRGPRPRGPRPRGPRPRGPRPRGSRPRSPHVAVSRPRRLLRQFRAVARFRGAVAIGPDGRSRPMASRIVAETGFLPNPARGRVRGTRGADTRRGRAPGLPDHRPACVPVRVR